MNFLGPGSYRTGPGAQTVPLVPRFLRSRPNDVANWPSPRSPQARRAPYPGQPHEKTIDPFAVPVAGLTAPNLFAPPPTSPWGRPGYGVVPKSDQRAMPWSAPLFTR